MNTKAQEHVIKQIMEEFCLFMLDVVYVDSVAQWCKEQGIEESDKNAPVKLVVRKDEGCKLVLMNEIPEEVIEQRIKAMSVRGSLQDTATDRASMLNSDKKKMAYFILSEYASHLPELDEDELLIDNWAFNEMNKLGFFKE